MAKQAELTDTELAMADRLRMLREHLKLNQNVVANGSNTNQGQLSGMEKGKSNIQLRVLGFYAEQYRANIEWLLTGEGEMLLDGKGEGQSRRAAQHLGLALVDTSGLVAWQQAVEARLAALEMKETAE